MKNMFSIKKRFLIISLALVAALSLQAGIPALPTFKAETLILMHNPMGIRIELNINQKELNLWISPKAGVDNDNLTRNFSNRDDHTKLFDRITLPDIDLGKFTHCDYNAFHSIIYFEKITLHLATLTNEPAVLVWFDQGGIVDIKSDKAATSLQRTSHMFATGLADRGFQLEFAAAMGGGKSAYRHQLQLEKGRSIYTQAKLEPGQPLVFFGGVKEDNVTQKATALAQKNLPSLLEENKKRVNDATQYGKLVLKNKPELQKLIDINKEIYFSMVDASGAVRAAIQNIYYMIWIRDGGMSSALLGSSGWLWPLKSWTEFLLANPTEVKNESPQGRMFGQLTNKSINKWEEDGNFYAIWSAFTHWTQTGDRTSVSGDNLKLLEESMDWLERYCYSEKKQAFGRYYYGETSFVGSRDYNYDNAIGVPTGWGANTYKDSVITKAFDMYVNMTAYTNYIMLAAMQTDKTKQTYFFEKATRLEPFLRSLYRDGTMPDYGDLVTINGNTMRAEEFGMDETDHVWGLTLPYFYPDYENLPDIRNAILKTQTADTRDHFVSGWFSLLASMDVEFSNKDSMMWMVDYVTKQSIRPGKYLPMPYTIMEMTDQPDGQPWHDVRPQGFSIASMLAAINNFAVRRLPFGVAVRANNYINAIEKYQYKGSLIDFNFIGEGEISSIRVDGKELLHTWVIPNALLAGSTNHTVSVQMNKKDKDKPVLISTTAELVSKSVKSAIYLLKGFGRNSVVFKNLKTTPRLTDAEGNKVVFKTIVKGKYTYLDFNGYSDYRLTIN